MTHPRWRQALTLHIREHIRELAMDDDDDDYEAFAYAFSALMNASSGAPMMNSYSAASVLGHTFYDVHRLGRCSSQSRPM